MSAAGEKKLIDVGMIPGAPTPPAELARFLAREVADWGKVVRQAGSAGIEWRAVGRGELALKV